MDAFDEEENFSDKRLKSDVRLDLSQELTPGELQLDLSHAWLLFHQTDEEARKLRPLRQTVKSHTSEMTIGTDAFALRQNKVAPLFEASYRTVDTPCGRIILPHDQAETMEIANLKKRVWELEQRNADLESQVNADALTGLLNRRGIDNVLVRELAYAKRTGSHLLAALIDLDNFKAFNDIYGHHIGDEVLRCVAQVMKDKIRASDWSSRVGGDEFLILLPCTALVQGINVLDRVRLSICDRTIVAAMDLFLRTTVSIGIARLNSNVSKLEDVLQVTTKVLKRSKAEGKNRISAEPEAEIQKETFADTLATTLGNDFPGSGDPSGREQRC